MKTLTETQTPNLRRMEELYQEHYARVLDICRYRLGSIEEAEDAASEIFARLPAALRTYDAAKPFDRWLSRVAHNYCIDIIRRRKSEGRILLDAGVEVREPASPAGSPLERLLEKETRDLMRDAVDRLPDHYRRPLVQRYWQDLGYHEIGRNLGLTRANVATLIYRAKNALKATLALNRGTKEQAGWAW